VGRAIRGHARPKTCWGSFFHVHFNVRRAAAVWERYPLGRRPGHEAEYEYEHRAGAARERKHRAAARRRGQHHGSDILRYPDSKGATGGDRGSRSWRRKGEGEQTIRRTEQSSQRTWGGSAYFKGTHRQSAVSPVTGPRRAEQRIRAGARLRLAKRQPKQPLDGVDAQPTTRC
jgi:hypothetical protein